MPVQRFVTKRVEIDAMQFTGENHHELYAWTGGLWDDKHDRYNIFGEEVDFKGSIFDELHQTWISVAPGMWIVRGARGEFYPCADDTFHWKYEEIADAVL